MRQRRVTRLTNAFSKETRNLKAAMGLHFMHYNFVRVHEALGVTPAVAAGIAKSRWFLEDLVRAALAAGEMPVATPPKRVRKPRKPKAGICAEGGPCPVE